jgi:hypothetical protein
MPPGRGGDVSDLSYPVFVTPLIAVAGVFPSAFSGAKLMPQPLCSEQDFRLAADTNGTISNNNNRVMARSSATDAEEPFPGARVRLHRLADGYLAWQGVSDKNGYYWPSGLEVGVEYYPVAIDLERQFECVAAGPARASARRG